jgi:hypothetical protein
MMLLIETAANVVPLASWCMDHPYLFAAAIVAPVVLATFRALRAFNTSLRAFGR